MRSAFTMVEVLTCVAIIGLLLAILLPVVLQSKLNAHKSTCQNNLRSVGQAIRIYVDDNDGTWPDFQVWVGWNNTNTTKLAGCPMTQIPEDKVREMQIRGRVPGYAYNASIVHYYKSVGGTEGNTYPVYHPATDRDFVYPAVTVAFMDAGINSWLANEPDPYAHIRPYPYNAEHGWERHNGGGNYLFSDNHVQWYPAGQVQSGATEINDGVKPTLALRTKYN